MAERAKSIPELPSLGAPALNDLLLVVDTSSANATKQTTISNVLANVSNNDLTMANNVTFTANTIVINRRLTPANGTSVTVKGGTIFFDTNYIYVAIADDVVKRVSLETF